MAGASLNIQWIPKRNKNTVNSPRPLLLLVLVLLAGGCTNYSSVIKVQPGYRSDSAAGEGIDLALSKPSADPLIQMGRYLDAASTAANDLKADSGNTQAREDYNFAISRLFGVIHAARLEPWKTPVKCPGLGKVWNFSVKRDPQASRNPSNFDIQPADTFAFKGSLVKERTLKSGLGAPLVVVGKSSSKAESNEFQVSQISYGMTGVVFFEGNNCSGSFLDPLAVETVDFEGHSYPLAADFTAPVALALANQNHRQMELDGLFHPMDFESKARLALLQPYDSAKIPILCVHGLGDSQATWAPLIQALRGDPVIRKNYQFWYFSYPTGYPYPLSAAVLRRRLDAINSRFPDHKKIVVIGHSMGGMISRTLITDSGLKLWDAIYDKPPMKMGFTSETRKVMVESLIFKPRTDIARVIFASPSHRGSEEASNFWGRLGSRIIGSPQDIVADPSEALAGVKPKSTGEQIRQMPNSIDFLNPKNRFVVGLAKLPTAPGVPYHTIIGDRGKGGNHDRTPPVSTDGIVPYWSSHLDGAKSELVIASDHWTNRHPSGIAEIDRILHEHLKSR